LASPLVAQSPFQFRFTQTQGPYAVGLKVVEHYDTTRPFGTTQSPRPLQTLFWYPAQASSAPTLSIGDYAALVQTETTFGKPTSDGKVQHFVADFTVGTTSQHTHAVRDAATLPGRYPVVIYAPSLNAPAFENIELCEYLASHGFLVLAAPNMGTNTREMTSDLAGANAGAQDIAFLIHYAQTLPNAQPSALAVMGYSWGGMSAFFAASRDPRIHALISLDGSFRYGPATVQQAAGVHPEQLTTPTLVFSRAEEPLETWDANHQSRDQFGVAPNVLNQLTHADLYHLHMLAMSHIEFSSLFLRSERFKKDGPHFSPADYSIEDGAISYNWVARYTLEFLKASLQQDPAATTFLKRTPSENGVPPHLVWLSYRPAAITNDKVPGGI
jgi:dienelactone hydrolase